MRLHNNRIEELVTQLKQLNQRLTALEGQLLRMAEGCKVPRDDFLKQYRGYELDPNWIERMATLPGKGWKLFIARHSSDIAHDARRRSPRWRTMPACRSASSAAST